MTRLATHAAHIHQPHKSGRAPRVRAAPSSQIGSLASVWAEQAERQAERQGAAAEAGRPGHSQFLETAKQSLLSRRKSSSTPPGPPARASAVRWRAAGTMARRHPPHTGWQPQ